MRKELQADVEGALEERRFGATSQEGPLTWLRGARYVAQRLVVLAITVAITVYLAIIVVNLGGYLDEIIRGEIALSIAGRVQGGWLDGLPADERLAQIEATTLAMERAQGLDQPLALRSVRWLWRAITLQWGEARTSIVTGEGRVTNQIRDLILDALPRTLLMFALANLLVFVTGVLSALPLSRSQGRLGDRAIALLAPLAAGPPWIYGILLVIVTFRVPMLRPLSRQVDIWPERFQWSYVALILQAMVLPVLSVVASKLVQSANQWRTYFMLYRTEDYVDQARAAGLPRHRIERRYILRPALPAVLTSLALLLVGLWQEVIVLEYFFRVAGVGRLLIRALRAHDVPLTLALVVLFAYLLALTLLLLDIVVVCVDPRVRQGATKDARRAASRTVRARHVRRPMLRAGGTLRGTLPPFGARLRAWVDLPAIVKRRRSSAPERWRRVRAGVTGIARRPAAVAGLTGIALLTALAVYGMLIIPYREAVSLWQGVQATTYALPENALPEWVDWLNGDRMVHTLRQDSRAGHTAREEIPASLTTRQVVLTFPLDYDYERYPQDLAVFFYPEAGKEPYVSMVWRQPDGQEIALGNQAVRSGEAYHASMDQRLARRLKTDHPERALFGVGEQPLTGAYTLEVTATLFDPQDSLEAEVVVYGEVYGAAGTDGRRRDVMVAVLWGTAVALAFGILAALGSTIASALIAGASAWYGGIVDGLVQRISEVNMVLPSMAVSLLVFTLYSKSFWVVLGVTVALSIFGSGMRTYRATLQQAVASPWVEAARAQGASGPRVIGRYLLPYLAPIMVPQMVSLVPSYVFLEAALAYLGMSDPSLPTWGRLVQEAFAGDVYGGNYHLVLVPAMLLLFMAFSFGLLGRSLEQVLNPRLRDR